jgi:hypothetical protein
MCTFDLDLMRFFFLFALKCTCTCICIGAFFELWTRLALPL